jgi:hypothetical protein
MGVCEACSGSPGGAVAYHLRWLGRRPLAKVMLDTIRKAGRRFDDAPHDRSEDDCA